MGQRRRSFAGSIAGLVAAALALGALAVREGERACRSCPLAIMSEPGPAGLCSETIPLSAPGQLPNLGPLLSVDQPGWWQGVTAAPPRRFPNAGGAFPADDRASVMSDPLFPAAANLPENGPASDPNAAALADIRAAAAGRLSFDDPGPESEPPPPAPEASPAPKPEGPPHPGPAGPLTARPAPRKPAGTRALRRNVAGAPARPPASRTIAAVPDPRSACRAHRQPPAAPPDTRSGGPHSGRPARAGAEYGWPGRRAGRPHAGNRAGAGGWSVRTPATSRQRGRGTSRV